MTAKKPLLLATLSLSVCLTLVSIPRFVTRVQAQQVAQEQLVSKPLKISQAFTPPKLGAPSSTAGGGVRSTCIQSATPLTALIPGNSLPLTVATNPTFLVYIPKSEAKTAEFVLKDEQENDVFRKTMPLPATSGIVSFTMPSTKQASNLEVGKNYHWYWALICKPEDRREDVFVDAWIQRTALPKNLSQQLIKVAPQERVALYAKNGIWGEAVSTLADLHRAHPNDPKITANWQELLKSVGLEKIAEEPLLRPSIQKPQANSTTLQQSARAGRVTTPKP
ncbi:MAG: hypothetical protein NVS2B14_12830 [Chamaesiphon sp.]